MISVIIPTVRNTILNEKCLAQQTHQDFETIIVRPVGEKPKDLFWTWNRDMNRGFRQAKGELIVSYQDLIKIKPDTLERFWYHYEKNNRVCVGAVGDQYSSLEPPVKVWTDPRKRLDYGTFYEVNPIDIEFTLCSLPKKAIYEVGGLDEEYDKVATVGEKEMMIRIDKLGYKVFLDQSIEYMAEKHPRLTKDWDEYYARASEMYAKHFQEVQAGTRLKLDFL